MHRYQSGYAGVDGGRYGTPVCRRVASDRVVLGLSQRGVRRPGRRRRHVRLSVLGTLRLLPARLPLVSSFIIHLLITVPVRHGASRRSPPLLQRRSRHGRQAAGGPAAGARRGGGGGLQCRRRPRLEGEPRVRRVW